MTNRTTRRPQPSLPSFGWQPVGTLQLPAEQLMERFAPGMVVAILDHRAKIAKARVRSQQAGNEGRRKAARGRDLAAAAKRHRAGEHWKEIAPDYGLSADRLRRLVREAGLPKRRRTKSGRASIARF